MRLQTFDRGRKLVVASQLCVAVLAVSPVRAEPQQVPSSIETLNLPGAEARRLTTRAGDWDATITIWPAPGAEPIVARDLVARRRMVGQFLEERITPRRADPAQYFERVSYLHFNRVEGRWQYVSMDTRFPAGIMPASSIGPGTPDRIDLEFEPIAFPGWGASVDGWMLRSSYSVSGIGTDHEIARQDWTRADGTGRRWLAVQFDYRRPRSAK